MSHISIYDPTKAELRLAAAMITYQEINETADAEEFERLWTSFLVSINGVFTLLEKACQSNSRHRNWFNLKKRQIRTDTLLQYIIQARNSDEHSTQFVSGFSIQSYAEADSDVFFSFDLEKMRPVVRRADGSEVPVETTYVAELREVVNRGRSYPPPQDHLGKPLSNPRSPAEVATLALGYASSLLDEANSFV